MAHNLHHLISCITLLFLLLLVPSNSENTTTIITKPQPFGNFKHLEGCKKGETLAGVSELKQYLNKFGYLNYRSSKGHYNDEFNDFLEAAMKTYQANYNLNVTGTLDSETISMMAMPRCGVPDIINGTNTMRNNKKRHHQHPKKLHTVSHYTFFDGSPRWPVGKTSLTYWFDSTTPSNAKPAFVRSFDKWASVTQYFTFSETQDSGSSDIKIGFARGDHGDGYPFDGPGGILAHGFRPTIGKLHCDAEELWSVGGLDPNYFDLETVVLHETGHLLGLGHSEGKNDLMYAYIPPGVAKDIQDDDLQGIKALYNI
ncbi:metalloendoproteinase 3-MMP-like [Apium graveolens]|uniref:metalloendoproteinase 3-MMP-like n=1 Tax=Apium graveolens TaxID=4045 RepID=UPI003D7B808A